MSKKGGCGCSIQGFDGDGMMEGAMNVAAGYGGYRLADYASEEVEYLRDNPTIDGGIKVGTAIFAPIAAPSLFNKQWKWAALAGWGAQGVGRIIHGLDSAKEDTDGTNGIGDAYDWDSYGSYRNNDGSSNMV